MLLFYRALIRSKIDYGLILYGATHDTQLKKIETSTLKALKISIGALKSSPNNTVFVEYTEPPLKYRIRLLADRYFIKNLSNNADIISSLGKIKDYLYYSFCKNKKSPPLVNSMNHCYKMKPFVETNDVPLCFRINLEIYNSLINAFPDQIMDSINQTNISNVEFEQKKLTTNVLQLHIFTDGSKKEI